MAASNRVPSAWMSDAWILVRAISGTGSTVRNTGPMAMPGQIGMPNKRRSGRGDPAPASCPASEAAEGPACGPARGPTCKPAPGR